MGLVCLLLWCPQNAWAQATRQRPVRESTQDDKRNSAPEREAPKKPLTTKQLEEALRLLLKVDSVKSASSQRVDYESNGLVMDQTITKIGHDFYDVFYSGFEPPVGITDYVIVIVERRGRGTSALVAVSVNDQDLLEIPLQPKYDLIEEAASQAIGVVSTFLIDAQNVSRQLERGETNTTETF